MSAPNKLAGKAARPASAGRVRANGTRIYRLAGPQVIWWTWVGVVVLGLGDLAISGRDWLSLKVTFGLLAATGVVYACALWPCVVADDEGMIVQNPIRRFRIPWAAVKGIFLADSVEVQCARRASKRDKTVYSWALASPRRARARAQLRARQWDRGMQAGGRPRSRQWGGGFNNRPSDYDRLPESAKAVAKLTTAEVMARELGQLSEEARTRSAVRPASADGEAAVTSAVLDQPGATGAVAVGGDGGQPRGDNGQAPQDSGQAPQDGGGSEVMSAHWSWPSLAAFLLPAAALTVVTFIH